MIEYNISIEKNIFTIIDNYSDNIITFEIGKFETTHKIEFPQNCNPAFQMFTIFEMQKYLKDNFSEYLE